jgi:hypothetical protein
VIPNGVLAVHVNGGFDQRAVGAVEIARTTSSLLIGVGV